jgi:ribosomal protein S18 acetylase RimI-like enzyme
MTDITIIRPAAEHRSAWDALYKGYADFYKVEQTLEMRDCVWSWLHDANHSVKGFLAVDAIGKPVGLTHYRPFARPLTAATSGFLDDLFVDPTHRGSNAAQALIDAVSAEGRKRGWGVVRWITAEDNYRARGLYDRVSTKTKWLTYEIKL